VAGSASAAAAAECQALLAHASVAILPPPCPSTPLSSRPLPRPCVGDVLGTLARGCSEAELLGDFPQLTHEDVLACLAFAAERERRLMVATLA